MSGGRHRVGSCATIIAMTTTAHATRIATDARYVFAGDILHDGEGDHLVIEGAIEAADYPRSIAIVCHTIGTPTRFRYVMPNDHRVDVTPAYVGRPAPVIG